MTQEIQRLMAIENEGTILFTVGVNHLLAEKNILMQLRTRGVSIERYCLSIHCFEAYEY